MARIMGERPSDRYPAETAMYKFVKDVLPDYISAAFHPAIKDEKGNISYEFDLLLFVPHMGVYILEIKEACGFQYKDGKYSYLYANGRSREISSDRMNAGLMNQRYALKHYLKRMFNISPFIYEFECFPSMSINNIDKDQLPPEFDLRHVITSNDMKNHLYFLHNLIGCTIFDMENLHFRFEKDTEDLTDVDIFKLFNFWGYGAIEENRPERPPCVFLSYNRNNNEISKEVQHSLETLGLHVWRAPKDVPLGEYYLDSEMKEITDCDAFVILLSVPAENSEEVKKEFEKALELDKPIIPIWVEDIQDSDITDYYREKLTKYQYRIMPRIDYNVITEISDTVKKLKREKDNKGENTD
ncbi:MAG: TIR domain-containing protein [Lachnospiraceae bacterium]|nr:TIR domain-containing protein [Lachnospiraceae bacterium]